MIQLAREEADYILRAYEGNSLLRQQRGRRESLMKMKSPIGPLRSRVDGLSRGTEIKWSQIHAASHIGCWDRFEEQTRNVKQNFRIAAYVKRRIEGQ